MPLCCPKPPGCTSVDEYEWAVQLIANPSHVYLHRLHPKAHHSALSHSVTHDNQERDYGDQINYGLIQNAMDLTTVNPALPKHWRRLITLILPVTLRRLPCPPSLRMSQERGIGLSSTTLLILPLIYDDQHNISKDPCSYFLIFPSFSCHYFVSRYCICMLYERYQVFFTRYSNMNTIMGLSDYTHSFQFILCYCLWELELETGIYMFTLKCTDSWCLNLQFI